MAVAPHENNELELILQKVKHIAVIEKNKAPEYFADVLEQLKRHDHIDTVYYRVREGKEGTELVLTQEDFEYLDIVYESLLDNGIEEYGLIGYHRAMGRLFGYSEEDINDFINSEIAKNCQCSKCRGE